MLGFLVVIHFPVREVHSTFAPECDIFEPFFNTHDLKWQIVLDKGMACAMWLGEGAAWGAEEHATLARFRVVGQLIADCTAISWGVIDLWVLY